MIHYVVGDLLESDCDVIMHQCNCFTKMGAGIARSIKQKYPEAYQADREFCYKPKHRLGQYSYGYSTKHRKVVVNLYGQFDYGNGLQTDYRALESALDSFLYSLSIHTIMFSDRNSKVGVPFMMGCGLAGGNWLRVEAILKEVSEKRGIDIYIYKLRG